MSELETRAKAFATKAHGTQTRKYTGEPYITHCQEVADLVRTVGGTPEMIAAAWLHDVVEDTSVQHEDIEHIFGREVALLVFYLTDASKPSDGNRAKRKAIDRLHISDAPAEAHTIKLADLISNAGTINKHDPDFAVVYMREKRELLKVLKDGDERLWHIGNNIVEGYFQLHPEHA